MAGELSPESPRPISDTTAPGSAPTTPLTESQIMRVLGNPPPDRFTILNRQGGRSLSDTTVVGILMAKGDSGPRELPLPVAPRWTRLTRPLNYGRRGRPREPNELSRLPMPYRVTRLVLWLGVAAEMIAVMINSFRLG